MHTSKMFIKIEKLSSIIEGRIVESLSYLNRKASDLRFISKHSLLIPTSIDELCNDLYTKGKFP